MLTPFDEAGKVDFGGLTALTQHYLRAGAGGLFANCQSSEMFALDHDEKLAVVKHVLSATGGAVPVVAVGNFGETPERQADFMHKIYDTGVQAVIIVTSLVAGKEEPDRLFEERVFRLFELTGSMPLGFYECPEPYKRVLKPAQLRQFVDTGRIIYHKDTCLDLTQITAKLEATAGRPAFGLYDAYAAHAVASLKAGSSGLSCIQGNFFPELIVWLCEHFDEAAFAEKVDQAQRFLSDNMEVMHHIYPPVAKYYLRQRGLPITTFTRTDTGTLTPAVKQDIDHLSAQYARLCENIGLRAVMPV
ncbi:dihydrodipicolinate synthase family protein [Compostibacter hankyongensis]|uniref:Dihydrodipicolinate synthase family protein n=2 Tax=Compostibacter hankyongensis TaxID=1007089 RepID=A0ABP8FJW2_9BACT